MLTRTEKNHLKKYFINFKLYFKKKKTHLYPKTEIQQQKKNFKVGCGR